MPTINLLPKKKKVYKNTNRRAERQEIYNKPQWKKLRKAYLQEHPLCEECLKQGKVTADNLQVHHRISFMSEDDELKRKQLAYDWNNLETVCFDCHQKLHGNVKGKKKKQ